MASAPLVLVVDDELRILDFLRTLLTREGYAVADAVDGEEAIARLDAGRDPPRYALLLLDLSLPLVDGLEVLEHLAAVGDGVPVVAMSTHPDRLPAALARGARAAITKPFALDDLLALVAQHARTV